MCKLKLIATEDLNNSLEVTAHPMALLSHLLVELHWKKNFLCVVLAV